MADEERTPQQIRLERREERLDARLGRREARADSDIENNPYYSESVLNDPDFFGNVVGSITTGLGLGSRIKDEMDYYKDMEFGQFSGGNSRFTPNYGQVSSMRNEVSGIDPGQAGKGLAGQGALTGLKAGATIGSMFPGFGTLIGGAAGAAGGAIFGAVKKNKIQEEAERKQAEGRIAFGEVQDQFNIDVGNYYKDIDFERQNIEEERSYLSRAGGGSSSPFQSLI